MKVVFKFMEIYTRAMILILCLLSLIVLIPVVLISEIK